MLKKLSKKEKWVDELHNLPVSHRELQVGSQHHYYVWRGGMDE